MCVICRKAKGAKLPDAKTIMNMWDTNPHGAGAMWREGRNVCWVKGFMEFDAFSDWLERNRSMLDATECALHFRITTSGGTNQQNCHPFPLSAGTNPHALKGKCKIVMMHNGVMPIKPRKDNFSDTAEFAVRSRESGDPLRFVKSVSEFVAEDNRLCVFHQGGTILVGDWKKRKGDGCDYSNLNFDVNGWMSKWYDDFNPLYHFDTLANVWKDKFGNVVDVAYVDPYEIDEADMYQYEDDIDKAYRNRVFELDGVARDVAIA